MILFYFALHRKHATRDGGAVVRDSQNGTHKSRYIGFVLEHYRGTSPTHFNPLPFVSPTIHFAFGPEQEKDRDPLL
jgi:hypothetical protein